MAVTIKNLGGIQREITLTIPAESIAQEINKRLNDLTTKARIDGFRPGKVPAKVIKDRFGASIHSEALNTLINNVYEAAMKEANIYPAGPPEVKPVDEKIEQDKPFSFTASFQVFPDIELKNFAEFVLEKPVTVLEEADIDKAIERVREQRATKNEQGENQLPELDDTFIATLGVTGGLEELRKEVRKNLDRELKYELKNRLKAHVIEQLVAAHEFDIPKALIEREAERMFEESKRYFKQMNPKMSLPEIPLELFKENAQKNVKTGLLFGELLEKHQIEATQDKIDERIHDMATMYDDVERAIQWIRSDKRQLENIRAQVREEALIDSVLKEAKVSDKLLTYDELIQKNGLSK